MSTEQSGGARWTSLLQYHHGCHSYSQLVQFKNGKIGVAFDDSGPFPPNYDPARGQCKPIVQNVTFVLIELAAAS